MDSHPDTIGHLTETDIVELKDLRQTEIEFYTDENATELVHTAMADLHAMAQMSKFIRGLLRFNRNQDQWPLQNPPGKEKMISEHFNEETILDLIEILHGQQFKRSYFLEKSNDYLIRMSYISNQLDVPSLSMMIDDCIFHQAKWDRIENCNIDSLTSAIEYALKTENSALFERLNSLIRFFDLEKILLNMKQFDLRSVMVETGC